VQRTSLLLTGAMSPWRTERSHARPGPATPPRTPGRRPEAADRRDASGWAERFSGPAVELLTAEMRAQCRREVRSGRQQIRARQVVRDGPPTASRRRTRLRVHRFRSGVSNFSV